MTMPSTTTAPTTTPTTAKTTTTTSTASTSSSVEAPFLFYQPISQMEGSGTFFNRRSCFLFGHFCFLLFCIALKVTQPGHLSLFDQFVCIRTLFVPGLLTLTGEVGHGKSTFSAGILAMVATQGVPVMFYSSKSLGPFKMFMQKFGLDKNDNVFTSDNFDITKEPD